MVGLTFVGKATAQEADNSPFVSKVPSEVYCGSYQELASWLESEGQVLAFEGRTGHKKSAGSIVYFYVDPSSSEFTHMWRHPDTSEDRACLVDHGLLSVKNSASKQKL